MAKRILVVDDEEDILKTVSFRLKSAGYDVVTASDGLEGLNKARSEDAPPDLIILDLMLPKIDGYKVCRMLKFDENYRDIPVILFTARSEESDKKVGKDVGADAYIVKPFESQVLLENIKALLTE
ncbi:MAG: response regulator [Candidatus Omnitrophica bacterium]|nr:response regulator [Candidatus Omnitrophota bacterium]MBU1869841.1 response regulator [Candidatus Omnitrophota bacterium]